MSFFNTMFGNSESSAFWHTVLGQLGVHEKFGDTFNRRNMAACDAEVVAAKATGDEAAVKAAKQKQAALRRSLHLYMQEVDNNSLAAVDLRPFVSKVRGVCGDRKAQAPFAMTARAHSASPCSQSLLFQALQRSTGLLFSVRTNNLFMDFPANFRRPTPLAVKDLVWIDTVDKRVTGSASDVLGDLREYTAVPNEAAVTADAPPAVAAVQAATAHCRAADQYHSAVVDVFGTGTVEAMGADLACSSALMGLVDARVALAAHGPGGRVAGTTPPTRPPPDAPLVGLFSTKHGVALADAAVPDGAVRSAALVKQGLERWDAGMAVLQRTPRGGDMRIGTAFLAARLHTALGDTASAVEQLHVSLSELVRCERRVCARLLRVQNVHTELTPVLWCRRGSTARGTKRS